MKMCPQCGRVYADDLTFCLQDGSVLAPEPPEAVGEEPTVVRAPKRPEPVGPRNVQARKSPSWLKWAIPAVVLLVAVAVVAIAAVLLLRPMLVPSNDQAATSANSNSAERRSADNRPAFPPSPSPTPIPSRTVAPAKNNDGSGDNRNANADPDEGIDGFTDPGPGRITFRRGSVGETVTGRIAEERSFLLFTMAGQTLSARVRSAGDCVEFAGGGTSTSYSTSQGDSRVTIVNNCDRPSRFSLSVTVR